MGESAADGVWPVRLKNDVNVPALLPKKLLLLRHACKQSARRYKPSHTHAACMLLFWHHVALRGHHCSLLRRQSEVQSTSNVLLPVKAMLYLQSWLHAFNVPHS